MQHALAGRRNDTARIVTCFTRMYEVRHADLKRLRETGQESGGYWACPLTSGAQRLATLSAGRLRRARAIDRRASSFGKRECCGSQSGVGPLD